MMDTRPKVSSARKRALSGCNVVVTRPQHQAGDFADLIRAEGGCAVLFPALEILDADDLRPLQQVIGRLEQFNLAIFISANAVNKAMSEIAAHRALPATLKIAAIGSGSNKALQRFGLKQVIYPVSRFDSEALLELPMLRDVAGKRIVIFRGQGGRELLGETLAERGARVEYVECYRRAKPNADLAQLKRLWAGNKLHAVTATSSEGLRNLYEMMDETGRELLKKTPLFVPHPRIAKAAREMNFANVIVTGAGDAGLVKGLIEWFGAEAG